LLGPYRRDSWRRYQFSARPDFPRRDRFVKRDLDERHCVREYWIADPETRTVGIASLQDGACGSASLFEAGDTIEDTAVLQGLGLAIDSIWG
jgi:Uma2 family endonuclease